MSLFSTPPGYKPADSLTISLATALGVVMIYNSKVGPAADVQASESGDVSINSSIKKAGYESLLLVAGMTFLTRDLNVAILGSAAVMAEHGMYLHADMASPSTGKVSVNPAAYQQAGAAGITPGLIAVAG